MVIGHQKGRDTKENIKRNFGMPHPEGYRKALRLMQLAARFDAPVITLIDTAGRLSRPRRRGARPVRGAGAQHPGDVGAADPDHHRRHRRGRLGRRARARRGRPHPDARELGLLGHLARRMRRDPLEGRHPARARRRGAQAHRRGPAHAQGHRRDHPGAGGRRPRRSRRRRRGAARRPAPPPRPSCGRCSPTGWCAAAPRSTRRWARTPRPDAADRRSPFKGTRRPSSTGPTRTTTAPAAGGGHRGGRPRAGLRADHPPSATSPRRSAAVLCRAGAPAAGGADGAALRRAAAPRQTSSSRRSGAPPRKRSAAPTSCAAPRKTDRQRIVAQGARAQAAR